MNAIAEQAGFLAAHAVWCVSEGSPFTPLLADVTPEGRRRLQRLVADDAETAVLDGRRRLEENPDAAASAILVYDGFIDWNEARLDAIVLDSVQYAPQRFEFRLAIPYRPAGSEGGFAVFRPKLLEVGPPPHDAEALAEPFTAAFFQGVDRHEQGAAVWHAALDDGI